MMISPSVAGSRGAGLCPARHSAWARNYRESCRQFDVVATMGRTVAPSNSGLRAFCAGAASAARNSIAASFFIFIREFLSNGMGCAPNSTCERFIAGAPRIRERENTRRSDRADGVNAQPRLFRHPAHLLEALPDHESASAGAVIAVGKRSRRQTTSPTASTNM
jgi:hypothetical protein